MKRVLCIVGSMNAGGAETFLMKMYRRLDKTKYQMDFAVAVNEKGFYDDEIVAMGGKIFHITPKSRGLLKNFKDIKNLVRTEDYKYVLRTSQHSLSALELFAAQLGGANKRVFRSSNSNTVTGSKKSRILHNLCAFMPRFFANVKMAPSTEAAEFMFGKNTVKKEKVFLMHNAVDLDIYKYDEDARTQVRRELNLENKNVVGHVGRFSTQKNHSFLIDVFNEIVKKDANAHLVLVGIGELMDEIREKVKNYNLSEKVTFLGSRSDVPRLLNAFDVLLFPSFYEGMPNVVIESQAAGLSCVVSDTITKEADITGLVTYLPLSAGAEKWCDTVLEKGGTARKNQKEAFVKNGYDIQSAADDFVKAVFD